MKSFNQYITEYLPISKLEKIHYLWEKYKYCDGFQFGWSSHISDNDWFPIFDMNYLRNYYQKYCDIDKINDGIKGNSWGLKTKWDRYVKGSNWYEMNRDSLAFCILNTDEEDPTEEGIINQLTPFLNKENNSKDDTKITVEKLDIYGNNIIRWRIQIMNRRLFPEGEHRELYVDIRLKEN